MVRAAVFLGLVAAIATALWAGAAAQSSCNSVLTTLLPCLAYIQGTSPTPSAQCCTQLGSVVTSQPKCLCILLNGGAGVTTGVNQTLALALPGACNVQTPPANLCNAAPPSSSPATPSTPPANGGTKAAPPPPGGNTSGGSSNRMALAVFFCTLFAAAFSTGIL